MTEDEAKQKFDALLKVLEPNRATLEAAGYRWPGTPFAPPPEPPPNPFKEPSASGKLKSLRDVMGK
jgi:hypothetical protein